MRRTTLLIPAVGLLLFGALLLVVTTWLQPVSLRAAALPAPSSQPLAAPMAQDGPAQTAGIVATGEGTIAVKPDLAKVTLGVEVTNSSAAGAQQDAASQMNAVMAQLKQQGIAEKDIQTVRFDLQPEYDYSTRTPVLKGYRATNLVLVTVRDISRVGGLLDAVVSSGATRLQGISFSVSDTAAAGGQGREEAMKNAREKADQLARLAGVTLGPPISIEETVSAPPAPMPLARAAAPALAGEASTPISPGTQDVVTMVRVVYSIR